MAAQAESGNNPCRSSSFSSAFVVRGVLQRFASAVGIAIAVIGQAAFPLTAVAQNTASPAVPAQPAPVPSAPVQLGPAEGGVTIPRPPASAAPTDDGQWTMPAKNFANTRYSELNEITTENVRSLQVAFTFSVGVNRG